MTGQPHGCVSHTAHENALWTSRRKSSHPPMPNTGPCAVGRTANVRPGEFHLDFNAMRAVLPADPYTDEALDIDDFEDDFQNYKRGILIVYKCTAWELATLIDHGLVGNCKAFDSDITDHRSAQPLQSFHVSLLEYVMPYEEKMRVCLERAPYDVHTSAYTPDTQGPDYEGHDILCAYLDKSFEFNHAPTVEGVKLILSHCDWNPVCDATLATVYPFWWEERAPEVWRLLSKLNTEGAQTRWREGEPQPLTHLPFGVAECPIGFARIGGVLREMRAKEALKKAFLDWLEGAHTFAPGGKGYKRGEREWAEGWRQVAQRVQ